MTRAVTFIAPISPFRGGIARHSEALARALNANDQVALEVESFSRLYPSMFYPGQSDRDPTRRVDFSFPVRYSLDTLNPLTWTKAIERISNRSALVVIPAWTFFVAPALGFIARKLRKRGVTVAMMVHNVSDHGGRRLGARALDWQLAAADYFVVHTSHLAENLRKAGRDQPAAILKHPDYCDFPPATGKLKRQYGLELLCFGFVRHYKGFDIAIRALKASGRSDVRLTIAGEMWDDSTEIEELSRDMPDGQKVEIINGYISDHQVAELFARCDVVLAPYRSVSGSGVAALARHYCRPIVASDLPGLREDIVHGQSGWIFNAGDVGALANLIDSEVTREAAAIMHSSSSKQYDANDWSRLADVVLNIQH
jgi:glycosyltransferase involved in cell wall biosynthesis